MSILQNARVIDVNRLAVAEERDDDPEADSSFGRGDTHYHEYKKLSGHIGVVPRERYERKIYGIEHQLDAHEHPEGVALEDNADRADRE